MSTTVEEDGNGSLLSSSLVSGSGTIVIEVQLDLKGGITTSERMFRGRMEFDSVEIVDLLFPS